jgi:hypothetical protein
LTFLVLIASLWLRIDLPRWGGGWLRFCWWVLLVIDTMLRIRGDAGECLIADQLFLFAEYAATIKTIPPLHKAQAQREASADALPVGRSYIVLRSRWTDKIARRREAFVDPFAILKRAVMNASGPTHLTTSASSDPSGFQAPDDGLGQLYQLQRSLPHLKDPKWIQICGGVGVEGSFQHLRMEVSR